MARKRKHKSTEKVELNLAAMLDMAFQLLAFFVLTFDQPKAEGQVSLRLPPPQPVAATKSAQPAGDQDRSDITAGVNSLIISVIGTPGGEIASMAVGEGNIADLGALDQRLKLVLSDKGNPFDQVIIQVGSSVNYESLMKVIDVCTKQTLQTGEKLTKLSFVELPTQ